MEDERPVERWSSSTATKRRGTYEYKSVRFKVRASRAPSSGWSFQPFGREPRDFATWEETVAAIEETCTAIAQHRTARRSR